MARDFLNIGCTPAEEPCQQCGMPGYDHGKAIAECEAFMRQIRRVLGREPKGASLRVKGFEHDAGVYFEVVCYYDDAHPNSIEYAFKCESEPIEKWDDTAKAELSGDQSPLSFGSVLKHKYS